MKAALLMGTQMYTVSDLESAKQEVALIEHTYDSNNRLERAKYLPQMLAAQNKLHQITDALWQAGEHSLTLQELLNNILDKEFPNTKNYEVVTYEGKIYQRVFSSIVKTISGKTIECWDKDWRMSQ